MGSEITTYDPKPLAVLYQSKFVVHISIYCAYEDKLVGMLNAQVKL